MLGSKCGSGHHRQDILKISELEDLAHMIVHIDYQRHLLASRNVVSQSVDLNIYHQDLNNKTNNASMKLSTKTHMLPTLTICFPLSLFAFRMLSWPNILDPPQLLHQLFCTKLLWLPMSFNLTIKTFLSPPRMVHGKETPMTNITYFIPDSSRARIFVTSHTRIVTSCDST